jgi:hypothetical protein
MQERAALIQKILDINALEYAYRGLREKGREKLASGELKLENYRKSTQEIFQQLEETRKTAMVENRSAKEVVFAFGPDSTAWDNGIRGAAYGLLPTLPWIVIAIWHLFNQPRSTELYPFWVILLSVLATVSSWTLIGFLFGYFYPYIRGNNGLAKSAWLFAGVVTPITLVAMARISSVDEKRALVLLIAQVFIQVVSLGLFVFDYATLRRNGFRGWRLVFEVHDLPMIGFSISSLLIALGVIVTTSVQSGASRLVGLALKLILPSMLVETSAP